MCVDVFVRKNQLDAQSILSIFRQLLHVSGVSVTHHQEVQPYVYNNWYIQDNRRSSKKNTKYQLLYTYDVAGRRPATSSVHYTTSCNKQSSAPEDGQNNFPKLVELTGIINKPLLLLLVGCLYYLYQ